MKTIGIAGGMGPYAGLDLLRKVLDQTRASEDQQHLDVVLLSRPSRVPDRTEFVLGRSSADPGEGIFEVLRDLERAGADVAGIPCNTAHSEAILQPVLDRLEHTGSRLRVVHMVREIAALLKADPGGPRRIGILATDGTVAADIYGVEFAPHGLEAIYPAPAIQHEKIHASIYDPLEGLKARGCDVSESVRSNVREAMRHLLESGAEAIVLACTELPMAVTEDRIDGRPVIDATLVLARALIRAVAPEKLR